MIALKPEAEEDLSEASAWYETKQTGLGVDFLLEVERTLARIERSPHGYRKVHGELRRAIPKRFPYSVFYLSEDRSTVIVYGVLHHRRAPASWQRRYGT